jgi:hypothetical protein
LKQVKAQEINLISGKRKERWNMAKLLKAFVLVPMLVLCPLLNSRILAESGTCPVSTIVQTVSYPASWALQWAPNNPPATIGNGEDKAIHVTGGLAPYSWAVSGHAGFTLADPVTTDVANTLSNNGACGTATITVTDARGSVVTGDVRSTYGSSWQQVGGKPTCGLPGEPDTHYDSLLHSIPTTLRRTVGGQRQTEIFSPIGGGRICDASCNMGNCDCNNAAYTANGGGCVPCLDLPGEFVNSSYSCRYSIFNFPLVSGTFYCKDYTVVECIASIFGYCGGNVPASHSMCFASVDQYYEEWRCNQ